MFRIMKLAAYGLLGYALYEFVRGALSVDMKGARQGDERSQPARMGQGSGQQGASQGAAREAGSGGQVLSGPAPASPGPVVATRETNGGSVGHRVGRGVI